MASDVERIVELMRTLSGHARKDLQAQLSRHNVSVDFRENCFNVEVPTKLGRGVRVRTGTSKVLEKYHGRYMSGAVPYRLPNKEGVITHIETGHGICYRVQYDSGGSGYFEPEELIILPVPRTETR